MASVTYELVVLCPV